MLEQLEAAVQRHARVGLVVDANLLVLFLLGTFDRNQVAQFKRTRAYSAEDFDLLSLVLGLFDRVLVTPAILAEVSNLAGQLRPTVRTEFFEFLQKVLPTQVFDERHIAVATVITASGFIRLGMTDAGIERMATDDHPVLTDDLDLYLHLAKAETEVFNFSHLRQVILMGPGV